MNNGIDINNWKDAPWVGVDDIVEEGRFVWSDGSVLPLDSDLWSPRRPPGHIADYQTRDCVAASKSALMPVIYDEGCANNIKPFICPLPLD